MRSGTQLLFRLPALLLAAALSACASAPPPRCTFPAEPTPAPEASAPLYRYRLHAGPQAEELCVEVSLPPGSQSLRGPKWTRPFLRDLAVHTGKGWEGIPSAGTLLGECAGGCKARYRFLLAEAARALDDRDTALEHRGAFISPPSSWMLRSVEAQVDDRYRLEVTTSPGVQDVTGVFHGDTMGNTVFGRLADLNDAPYAAFGMFTKTRVSLPGGTLDIALLGGEPTMGRARLEQWISAQARAFATYFGRFPIEHAAVLVTLDPGRGIGNGRTMGNGGASILLDVGRGTDPDSLDGDWILVHELCHVAFPNVLRPWAEEGLATYLEPIIRVRAGTLSRDELWRSLIEGFPEGQPEEGDRGLDHTDTWGRRYWGGAMFWFVGDLEIRKASRGTRSLDDALRAIVAAGGNVSVTWTLDRALEVGDTAVGGRVLRDLRDRFSKGPVSLDLAALWSELGVRIAGDHVVYDEGAKLASIRRAITATDGR